MSEVEQTTAPPAPQAEVNTTAVTTTRIGERNPKKATRRERRSVKKGDPLYFAQPSYYRLAYQLAAQQAHRMIDSELSATGQIPDGWGNLTFKSAGYARVTHETDSARSDALAVVNDSGKMLDWYRDRDEHHRRFLFWTPRELDRVERRLQRFLRETVHPCAVLLLGGMDMYTDGQLAADTATELTGVYKQAGDEELSYRGYYNLACFECARAHARGPDETQRSQILSRALGYLRSALSQASEQNRRELLEWARRDPSLEPLRKGEISKRYETLLTDFDLSAVKTPQEEAAAKAEEARRIANDKAKEAEQAAADAEAAERLAKEAEAAAGIPEVQD